MKQYPQKGFFKSAYIYLFVFSGFFLGCQTHYPSTALSLEEELLSREEKEAQEDEKLHFAEIDSSLDEDFFRWPVTGKVLSPFGQRGKKFHKGIDIKGQRGDAIKAASEGTVIYAGWKARYGKVVVIRHKEMETLYAHCDSLKVKTGEVVLSGQDIGTVGRTGNARGDHLHFEIRDKRRWINPLEKLPTFVASYP